MTKALRTSLAYFLMITATVLTVNLLTSPGFLWFLFPVFGIAWWPLSAYFGGRRRPFAYAVCGAALLCGLFVAVYLVASPGAHPWFLYPVMGVLWWPLSAYFSGRHRPLAYAVCGAALVCATLAVLYLAASPGAHPWFLYPVLGVLWWPLSVWGAKKGARAFSVAGGLSVILTLLAVNLIASPAFWWWVYPAFFALWWPVSVLLGEKAKTLSFAVGSAVAASLFTVLMHRVLTPDAVPWYLFTLLPFFWWPVCRLLSPRVSSLRLTLISVISFAAYYAALDALLFGVSDLLPLFLLGGGVWLLYAAVISRYRESAGFAALNAVLLAAYCVLVHRFVTPGMHPWYWYAFFPLAAWPLAVAMKEQALRPPFVTLGAAAFLAYYGALNLFLAPGSPWILFLTYPAAAAVLGSLCRENRAYLRFSVWMTAAGIAYFAAINLAFTPRAVWAVYPAFGLLWWPLSMWLHTRRETGEKTEE